MAYNARSESVLYDWQPGAGCGGAASGSAVFAVPLLMKAYRGISTELAIANLVQEPGLTDIAIFAYDQNGLIDWISRTRPQNRTRGLGRFRRGPLLAVFPWTPVLDGHFCFLARLEMDEDPITADGWVPFDNNICQKNMQILDDGQPAVEVDVGNRERGSSYGSLTLDANRFPTGASGTITFEDPELFRRWQDAGGSVEGGDIMPGRAAIRFSGTGGLAGVDDLALVIDRLPFEGEETSRIRIELDTATGETPRLRLVQWVDGRPVGGNILAPRASPSRVLLPYATNRAVR